MHNKSPSAEIQTFFILLWTKSTYIFCWLFSFRNIGRTYNFTGPFIGKLHMWWSNSRVYFITDVIYGRMAFSIENPDGSKVWQPPFCWWRIFYGQICEMPYEVLTMSATAKLMPAILQNDLNISTFLFVSNTNYSRYFICSPVTGLPSVKLSPSDRSTVLIIFL